MTEMKPLIGHGTKLSIGTVTRILNDGVEVKNRGNVFVVSREVAWQTFEDDRSKDVTASA